jgi:hypothetical protein
VAGSYGTIAGEETTQYAPQVFLIFSDKDALGHTMVRATSS